MEIIIPKDFRAKYSKILGDEYKEFIKYCKIPLRKSFRVNRIKAPADVIQKMENKGYVLEEIPWLKNAYWFKGTQIGNTIEHFLGYIYVQESASLIPPIILDPKENDTILDMCAAPGSKTTQMSDILNNRGCIIANDNNFLRLKALRSNIERLGCLNIMMSFGSGLKFAKKSEQFDKILLDAPCTSEGMIRKDWKVLSRWSLKLSKKMSIVQKQLINAAIKALKPKGTLVYSTCTFAPEENENVIEYAIEHNNVRLETIKVDGLKTEHGLTDVTKKCVRLWPQHNDTEGFFIAKLVKQ